MTFLQPARRSPLHEEVSWYVDTCTTHRNAPHDLNTSSTPTRVAALTCHPGRQGTPMGPSREAERCPRFLSSCLPARFFHTSLPSFNFGTRKPSPMWELKASLSGTKVGFFCIKGRRSSPCGRMLGPNRTSSLGAIGSFFKKEKEELITRPVPPWDIPLL